MEGDSPVGITATKVGEEVPAETPVVSEIKPSVSVKVRHGRTRGASRSVVVGLAVCFMGLAVLYLASVAPDSRQISSSVWKSLDRSEKPPRPAAQSAPVLPRDALAEIPVIFRAELMAPTVLARAELSRSFDRPVDLICDYLGSLGLGKFTTMHNPIAEGQWVCTSDVLPAVSGADPSGVSSVFVWLRGADRRQLDLFRLKINLTSPTSSDAAKSLALTLLQKLHDKFEWDMPEALAVAIRNVREANFVYRGVSYQIMREWSSLPRLNLVIRAADGSGILPTDNFATGQPQTALPGRSAASARLKPSIPASSTRPTNSDSGPIENLMQ